MKKSYLFSFFIIAIGLLSIILLNCNSEKKLNSDLSTNGFDFEERPDEVVSLEELAVNKRKLARQAKFKSSLKSEGTKSSYVDGKITGTWDYFEFLTSKINGKGHRILGSAYDSINDVLYVVSYSKHLWRIDRDEVDPGNTQWTLLNNKSSFNKYLEGVSLPDGSFRLINSLNTNIRYSDDEGRTWSNADGVSFTGSTTQGAIVNTDSGKRIVVVGKPNSSTFQPYFSTDYGKNFTASSITFPSSSNSVKVLKPTFSNTVYLLVRNSSTSKLSIYKCDSSETDFSLVHSPTHTFSGLNRVFGTYTDGNFHFYATGPNTHIYYSADEGATWTTTNTDNQGTGDRVPRTVHPKKPNVIFKGYLDVYMSTDYGASFSNFSHYLGWDVHHMKMYQTSDTSFFHFIGKDFGCFISYNPDVKTDYIQLNNTSPIQMCYDADNSQHYNTAFSATQDRGTRGFRTDTTAVYSNDIRSTDGLRVTLAKNEESVWTWMYFGSIFHKSNFGARKSDRKSKGWTGKWWAAPMIASPNKNEDAVYIAANDRLKKFTFNKYTQSILETDHYVDFNALSGSKITGFGYSHVNTNRWYVSVKTGKFYYSEDGGQTFTKTSYSGGVPKANDQTYNYHKNQHVIKASKIDENTVYYAGVGKYFLISKDGGKTFTNHTNGLDIYRMREFDLSPDEKYVYAACGTGGIWIYSVDDDKWYEMFDDPVPYVNYTNVEYMVRENVVRFSSYGNGVINFRLDVPEPAILYSENLVVEKVSFDSIIITWDDKSDNEDGFIIERATGADFTVVDSVPANSTSYTDTNVSSNDELYYYRVKAYNQSAESHYSTYALAEFTSQPGAVSKAKWQLIYTDSEEDKNPSKKGYAIYAFDGDINTKWHTAWYELDPKPDHPHEIQIDMNETITFKGFKYLPRQDGNYNGVIKDFEFYVSNDSLNWGTPVASGSWAKSYDEKVVQFTEVTGRYIRLVSLSDVNGGPFASCSELTVYNDFVEAELKSPKVIQAGFLGEAKIELVWLDVTNNEQGFYIEMKTGDNFERVATKSKNSYKHTLSGLDYSETYTFRIQAYNDNGTSEYSETITLVNLFEEKDPTRIKNDGFLSQVKIYPNPFSSEIHVHIKKQGMYHTIKVLDASGKLIHEKKNINFKEKLVLNLNSDLPTGVYYMQFIGNDFLEVRKLIKK